jgi:hypothetical protein
LRLEGVRLNELSSPASFFKAEFEGRGEAAYTAFDHDVDDKADLPRGFRSRGKSRESEVSSNWPVDLICLYMRKDFARI